MNLILSDRPLELPDLNPRTTTYIDLSQLHIANCVGCFGCWVKTPGKCVIRDDAVRAYPRIAESSRVLYVSRIQFGSYDTPMKTMLERAIPVQQAFIRLWHGEAHHVQRRVLPKQATIIGYGDISAEEQGVFRRLVARNAYNMNFESYQVHFVSEANVQNAVWEEVQSW